MLSLLNILLLRLWEIILLLKIVVRLKIIHVFIKVICIVLISLVMRVLNGCCLLPYLIQHHLTIWTFFFIIFFLLIKTSLSWLLNKSFQRLNILIIFFIILLIWRRELLHLLLLLELPFNLSFSCFKLKYELFFFIRKCFSLKKLVQFFKLIQILGIYHWRLSLKFLVWVKYDLDPFIF